MMKIIAFNGSPKMDFSNTNVMVTAFLDGAKAAGADIENIFLAKKNINYCKGCNYCTISGGKCSIKDDMANLLAKYVESDIVVFATPLYIENVSGILKVFMDRTFSLSHPYYETDKNGEYRLSKSKQIKNGIPPKFIIISNSGLPQRSNFQVISLLMKRFARNSHTEVIAEIFAPEGSLLTAEIKELEPIINDYKKLLYKAGQEIVRNMKLSEETQNLLEKNFIPAEIYVQEMNKYFGSILARPGNY